MVNFSQESACIDAAHDVLETSSRFVLSVTEVTQVDKRAASFLQGAYGPWKPWKVLEFRKPFSRSWKGLENCKNQEYPWKDLEFWRDKLDLLWKQDPRVEQRGSLSKVFGEKLGSKHERGGRRDWREGRRDAWAGQSTPTLGPASWLAWAGYRRLRTDGESDKKDMK